MKKIDYYIAHCPAEKGGDPIPELVSGYAFDLCGHPCAVRRTGRNCWHVDHIETGFGFPYNYATRREAIVNAYANTDKWSDAIAQALENPRNRSIIDRLAQLRRGDFDDFDDINPAEIRAELDRRKTIGDSFADRVVRDAERIAAV